MGLLLAGAGPYPYFYNSCFYYIQLVLLFHIQLVLLFHYPTREQPGLGPKA